MVDLALRLNPILPSNSQVAYKDTILPCGGYVHTEVSGKSMDCRLIFYTLCKKEDQC